MSLSKIALILVCCLAGAWALGVLVGMVAAFPFGLPVLAVFGVVGYLLYRVVRERLDNAEDDYYEKTVDK